MDTKGDFVVCFAKMDLAFHEWESGKYNKVPALE